MSRKQKPFLRVTEVCSFVNAEWYRYWAKSVGLEECERVSQESRVFGTGVHKVVENYLINTPLPDGLTDRQKFCGDLMVKWCKETNFKPLIINNQPVVEYTLISKKYGYIGHPDAIGTFGDDSTLWVLDWKTSKECRLEYLLQMSAYCKALQEQEGFTCNHGAILRTPNDPNIFPQFEAHQFNHVMDTFFPVFEEALGIVQFFKKRGKWKGILKGI